MYVYVCVYVCMYVRECVYVCVCVSSLPGCGKTTLLDLLTGRRNSGEQKVTNNFSTTIYFNTYTDLLGQDLC